MNLILFILAVIGMTHIVVDSEISIPVYKWIEPRCAILAKVMDCYQCAGFWCGLVLGWVLLCPNPPVIFAAACAGSFLAQLGYWTLEALEISAKRK